MADPIWQRNLRDAVLMDPLVIIHGNVKDVYAVPVAGETQLPVGLREQGCINFDVWLAIEFERLGFPIVLLYDPVDGAVCLRGGMARQFTRLAAENPNAGGSAPVSKPSDAPQRTAAPPLPRSEPTQPAADTDGWMVPLSTRQKPADFFRVLYQNVLARRDVSVAVICRFTDRYLSYTDRQDASDKELSLLIQKAAMAVPATVADGRIPSRIALVFDVEGAVPQELHVQAPFAHSVLIPQPTLEEREQFFRDNYKLFDQSEPGDRFSPDKDAEQLRLVANLADGLKMQDLFSLVALSNRERLGLGPRQVKLLLDRFRYGTRENAWQKVKPETLRNAKEALRRRVKGQEEVLSEILPVLIRAKLGMSDVGASKYSSKPRGAFFFVGPTGVGKTELSKAIAELIFGDETALIRFDMSEYSEEHQQARLIGAPPGYVGFDQGGQLTNAAIEHPFSVILFDEIEKAHGRILDKFLQILDDGRLTDGKGRTVYFSEAILIFTSNIGTAPRVGSSRRGGPASAALSLGDARADTSVNYSRLAQLDYDQLCDHFRNEVKEFFVNELGRPEILNRIGEDNILVFNFLTNDEAKNKIVDQQIESLHLYLRERHQIGLFCTKAFRRLLMVHPNGFDRNGARGVRNLLNKLVLNPLAEQLFLEHDACVQKVFRADYEVPLDRIKEEPFNKTALRYEWVTE